MLIQSGDTWHCTNTLCGSELFIGTTKDVEVDHVYCVCGAMMKKQYHAPVFTCLDFIGTPKTEVMNYPLPQLRLESVRKN